MIYLDTHGVVCFVDKKAGHIFCSQSRTDQQVDVAIVVLLSLGTGSKKAEALHVIAFQ